MTNASNNPHPSEYANFDLTQIPSSLIRNKPTTYGEKPLGGTTVLKIAPASHRARGPGFESAQFAPLRDRSSKEAVILPGKFTGAAGI
jgi:hypothetical protein